MNKFVDFLKDHTKWYILKIYENWSMEMILYNKSYTIKCSVRYSVSRVGVLPCYFMWKGQIFHIIDIWIRDCTHWRMLKIYVLQIYFSITDPDYRSTRLTDPVSRPKSLVFQNLSFVWWLQCVNSLIRCLLSHSSL